MKNHEKSDFVTALDLTFNGRDKQQTSYQFVYGSQLYGTLFGIYARFKGQKSSDGTSFVIRSVSLRLVNYQGLLNIGFTRDDIRFENENEEKQKELNLFFVVQGASRLFVKNFTFPTPITISIDNTPFLFNRILVPLQGFEPHERRGGKPGARCGDTPPLGFFDSEFYFRNGLDYYYNVLKPGMLGCNENEKAIPADPSKMPSGRCHRSKVILKF